MTAWRLTMEGTGQAVGDTLDEALYVPHGDDILTGFNAVENTGTGGLLKIVNTNVAQGARAVSFEVTAATSCYVEADDSAFGETRWYSTYLTIPSAEGSPPGSWDFIQCRDSATRNRCRINTSRQIAVVGPSTVTGTVALPLDTLMRVVYQVAYSASIGALIATVYDGHTSTVIDSVSSTGINTGAALGTNTRWGMPIQPGGAYGPVYFDDFRISDVADPGPSGSAPASLTQGRLKRWTGSLWVPAKPKVATPSVWGLPEQRGYV